LKGQSMTNNDTTATKHLMLLRKNLKASLT
jgi:hypothetical protein